MRLTLRTMLAYLDDVLDPSDAEQLGKKIQDSEFASGLVHRIRNSMRRLRLGVPKLDGKGVGLDANTVAEYLDSALAVDRIPDFEKVCLESDVHLAEVASCHQILTMVLGEPASVEPAVRERIYRIGAPPPEPSVVRENNGKAKTEASQTTVPSTKEKVAPSTPQVPDYLRAGSRRRLWPLAATAALAFLLAAVVLMLTGPLDSRHPLARLIGGGDSNQSVSQSPTDPSSETELTPPSTAVTELPMRDVAPFADSSPPPATLEATNGPDLNTADSAAPSSPEIVSPDERRPDVLPSRTPTPETSSDAASPIPGAPPKPAKPLQPLPGDDPDLVAPGGVAPGGATDDAATDTAPKYVGRFISDLQILSRIDGESGAWNRLVANTPIAAGDRLLVLPTYRPQVALTAGIQITFSGGGQLSLQPLDEHGTPGLSLSYGRMIMVTDGKVGARIGLQLSARRGEVIFSTADSALAVEVRRYLPPGTDPESGPALSVVRLFALGGTIGLREEGEDISIAAGQVRTLLGAAPGTTEEAGAVPGWITSRTTFNLDRQASRELETKVDFERPISLSLTERTSVEQERHVEVRSLAIRSLSSLDNHEPFVEALNTDDYRAFWEAQIEGARQALARSPQSAIEVRIALEKIREDDAAELYRMLWGYSAQQLANGSAEELVKALEHESMDIRILASVNLKRITGMTLLYRPEQSSARRRTATQKWREKLSRGEIAYKTAPSPIPPTKKVTPPASKPKADTLR